MKACHHHLGLAIAMLAVGCAPTPHEHYTVHIQSVVDDPETILEELAQWTAKTGVTFDLIFTSDSCGNDSCIEIREVGTVAELQDGNGFLEQCSNAGHLDGCTAATPLSDGNAFKIKVLRGLGPNLRHWVYGHELGHGLGMQHVPENDAIMHAEWNPTKNIGSSEITCNDVQQYNTLRGLQPGFCSK